jgi:rubrerythrin
MNSETIDKRIDESTVLNSLEEAISSGILLENEVAEFYESLSKLLSDPDYSRVILYTPFEFFPTPADQHQLPKPNI